MLQARVNLLFRSPVSSDVVYTNLYIYIFSTKNYGSACQCEDGSKEAALRRALAGIPGLPLLSRGRRQSPKHGIYRLDKGLEKGDTSTESSPNCPCARRYVLDLGAEFISDVYQFNKVKATMYYASKACFDAGTSGMTAVGTLFGEVGAGAGAL